MSLPHDYVIETDALSKRYGRKLALDHLTLRVPRGRIHAVVGANGAGKSTLFRILLGFLPPTAGSARILGRDSQHLTPDDRGPHRLRQRGAHAAGLDARGLQ
jgi:ABC-2 type transport system ATP-binding protein